jgi:hypothetical protein
MQETSNNNPETPGALAASKSEVTSEMPRAAVAVKRIKFAPEGINQVDVDAVLNRLAGMRKRLREDILFVGGRLAKMRAKIPHGRWGDFIEQTFPLSIKTANIWIRAWEERDSELARNDWSAYMRALYGNQAKSLRAPKSRHTSGEKQAGGFHFNPGFTLDKGKPSATFHKRFAMQAESEFFGSPEYTDEAKLREAEALKSWIDSKVRIFSGRVERRKEEQKD